MGCRSNSRSSSEFVKKIEELRLNLAVMAGAAKFASEIERSKRLVDEMIDDSRKRRQRLLLEAEPARKTDRLLADIAKAPITGGPSNDATTDALEGGAA